VSILAEAMKNFIKLIKFFEYLVSGSASTTGRGVSLVKFAIFMINGIPKKPIGDCMSTNKPKQRKSNK